jgi:hypothetical protein
MSENGVLKYGSGTEQNPKWAFELFQRPALNPISLCCTPIELLSNDGSNSVVATASGFFYQYAGLHFLVTNWHVVSGRNSLTYEVVSSQGYIPQRLRFYSPTLAVSNGNVRLGRKEVFVELSETAPKAFDFPPNVEGVEVDIFAIPLRSQDVIELDVNRTGYEGAERTSSIINNHLSEIKIDTRSGADCTIVGYPLRNYEVLNFPVWKSGMIASETLLGLGGRPAFLIDAAVTASMSGSPILRRARTTTVKDSATGMLVEQEATQLIGVYGGRLQSAKMEATNLGYGWYSTFIDKVIDFYWGGMIEEVKKVRGEART